MTEWNALKEDMMWHQYGIDRELDALWLKLFTFPGAVDYVACDITADTEKIVYRIVRRPRYALYPISMSMFEDEHPALWQGIRDELEKQIRRGLMIPKGMVVGNV